MGIKHQLHDRCLSYVERRITTAREAIRSAQLSANEETKSSSGDKYETGRAMAQLEIEKNSEQLTQAQKLKDTLASINPDKATATIQSGSLVTTSNGSYFIAIPAGPISVQGVTYYALSKASPLASLMMGLAPGSRFTFNGKTFVVEKIE